MPTATSRRATSTSTCGTPGSPSRRRRATARAASGDRVRAPVAEAQPRSIAVITFTNITREPADEWIGSGIAETVSSDLKSIHGLTVIGRERIFDALRNLQTGETPALDDRFAIEIGRGLGARWIVAGGYQRFGTEIRITARFVEVATGVVLRNVKIDGALADIFRLQDRIVFELTQGLQVELAGSEIADIEKPETRSVEAYELFSLGVLTLRLASRDAPDRAISLFEKALALDPEYAQAWAGLGGAYQLKGTFLNLPELLEKAIDVRRARAGARSGSGRRAHVARRRAPVARARGRGHGLAAARDRARAGTGAPVEHARARALDWPRRSAAGHRGAREGGGHQPPVRVRPPAARVPLHRAGRLRTRAGGRRRRAVDLQERYISGEEGLLVVGAHTRLGYVHYREGRYADAVQEYLRELAFLGAERSRAEGPHAHRAAPEARAPRTCAWGRRPTPSGTSGSRSAASRSALARGADDPATKYYAAIALALRGDTDRAVKYLEETWPRTGALNRLRVARDPDLESVRPALAAKGLLD